MGLECAVFAEGRQLMRVSPGYCSGVDTQVEIGDILPLALQAFLVWLTLLLWKRDRALDALPPYG
jgi:hypothetical protein